MHRTTIHCINTAACCQTEAPQHVSNCPARLVAYCVMTPMIPCLPQQVIPSKCSLQANQADVQPCPCTSVFKAYMHLQLSSSGTTMQASWCLPVLRHDQPQPSCSFAVPPEPSSLEQEGLPPLCLQELASHLVWTSALQATPATGNASVSGWFLVSYRERC